MKVFLIMVIVILSIAIGVGAYFIVRETINPAPIKTPTPSIQTTITPSALPSASASETSLPSTTLSPSSS